MYAASRTGVPRVISDARFRPSVARRGRAGDAAEGGRQVDRADDVALGPPGDAGPADHEREAARLLVGLALLDHPVLTQQVAVVAGEEHVGGVQPAGRREGVISSLIPSFTPSRQRPMPSRSRSMVAICEAAQGRNCWLAGLSLTSASLNAADFGGSVTRRWRSAARGSPAGGARWERPRGTSASYGRRAEHLLRGEVEDVVGGPHAPGLEVRRAGGVPDVPTRRHVATPAGSTGSRSGTCRTAPSCTRGRGSAWRWCRHRSSGRWSSCRSPRSRFEYMPLNIAARDGPHIGTSTAALTQSIQLASRLRSTGGSRSACRRRSSPRSSAARSAGSGGSAPAGRRSGPQAATSAAAPLMTLALFSSSRRLSVIATGLLAADGLAAALDESAGWGLETLRSVNAARPARCRSTARPVGTSRATHAAFTTLRS